jgi:hypothetical protein
MKLPDTGTRVTAARETLGTPEERTAYRFAAPFGREAVIAAIAVTGILFDLVFRFISCPRRPDRRSSPGRSTATRR